MKKCSIECSVEQKLNERSECSMFSAPIRALNIEQSSSLNNPRAKGNQLALSRLRDLALSAVLFLLVFPLVAAYLLTAFVAGALSTLARARLERELSQGLLDFGGGASAPTHNPTGQTRPTTGGK